MQPDVAATGTTVDPLSTAEGRLEFMGRHAPWSGLGDATRALVAAEFQVADHADAACLLRQDDVGGAMHVVVSGQLEVRIRAPGAPARPVAVLGPGDCVGEMSVLTGDPVSADVVSVGASRTLVLVREAFEALGARDPSLLRAFIGLLSQRVRARGIAVGAAQQRHEELTYFIQNEKAGAYGDLVGTAKTVKALKAEIARVAKDDGPVLVHGERGTGREAVARLIHQAGRRKDGPLLGSDGAHISETPLGDQLFGPISQGVREQGGFKPVCHLGLADGGTIVLANIEALPHRIQERLARFLGGESEAGPRHDVRVIAKSVAPPEELVATGQLLPPLAAALTGRAIAIPPLRERKKDIPALAMHFLSREAARLQKRVTGFSDEATDKLVSQAYRVANVLELRAVVERAVVLASSEVVGAEEIFNTVPPLPHRALPLLSRETLRRGLSFFPRGVRLVVAAVFLVILFLCFFGELVGRATIATSLVWSLWWPALLLSFFFFGRAWCAVCPMGTAGEQAQRIRDGQRRVPSWLKDHDAHVAAAGFVAIIWAEEASGMRHSAMATGLLLLTIATGAIATSVTFARRTWCKHLCPLGGFAGVCSSSSLIELRPTLDICAVRCTGHSCYKGSDQGPGCPMFAHVMFLESNADCVMCMGCIRTCPNGSPSLNLRFPGQELWSGSTPRPSLATFVGLLVGLLVALAVLQRGELEAWDTLVRHRLATVTAVLAVAVALPLAALAVVGRARRTPEELEQLHRHVLAWAPLVTAGFVGYHLGYLPGLDALHAGIELRLPGAPASALFVPLLSLVRAGIIAAGFVTTAIVMHRLAQPAGGLPWRTWLRRDVNAAAVPAGYAVLVGAIMGIAG